MRIGLGHRLSMAECMGPGLEASADKFRASASLDNEVEMTLYLR